MTQAAPDDDYISVREFREAGGTQDWPVLSNGATCFFKTASLAESALFVAAIAQLDGIDALQPDLDVRADGVTVRLLTRETAWWGMSRRYVELARAISAIAARQGL